MMATYESYDGFSGPAIFHPYDPPQDHCSPLPPLSPHPILLEPWRTWASSPHAHHALHLPSEVFQSLCCTRRAGHVSWGYVAVTQMWLPFCPACFWAGTKWQLPEKLLHFAALERSSATEASKWCKKLLQHCADFVKIAEQSRLSLGCVAATWMWPPFCPTSLWHGTKWHLPDKLLHSAALERLHSAAESIQSLLRQQNEAEATQMGLPFCGRNKTGTTFGTVPCSHAKKRVTPAFRKAFVSFRRKGRRRVFCLVGWESDLRPGRT